MGTALHILNPALEVFPCFFGSHGFTIGEDLFPQCALQLVLRYQG